MIGRQTERFLRGGSSTSSTPVGVETTELGMRPDRAQSPRLVSYSQNAEDVRLWRVLGTVEAGFYVDVGAGGPSTGSVTRLFYDRGWSGINIEPSPTFDELAVDRRRDVNLRVAIGEEEGEASLFVTYPDLGMSTLHPSRHADLPHIERTEQIRIPTRRLDSVLSEYAAGRTIHLLKIDVEGSESAVLASSDWTAFRPIVVVVEAVEPWTAVPTHEAWEPFLIDAGYEFAAFDGINRFYVERANRHLKTPLAYPVSPLDGFVTASQHEAEAAIAAVRSDLRRTEAEVEALREDLRVRAEEAEDAARENARLKASVQRLEVYQRALDAVLKSRTWRAGRAVAATVAPVRRVARLAGFRRPQARVRPQRRLTPAEAYAAATSPGSAWYFPTRGTRGDKKPRSPLERILTRLGTSGRVEPEAARRLVDEILQTGWARDESLLAKRLSWAQRQALVEADALAHIVLSSDAKESTGDDRPSLTRSPRQAVVVDARCLQSPDYRHRGVGIHAATVLAAIRELRTAERIVLLTSAELPVLDEEITGSADVVTTPFALRQTSVSLFVQLSPMTAPIGPAAPFVVEPTCRTVSVVYDFIPTAFPSAYLQADDARLVNRVRTEALRYYDHLLPISEATADAARRILGSELRASVTGVADPLAEVAATSISRPPFMVVPAGGDARKNTAAAVAALARYRRQGERDLHLVVTGVLSASQAASLDELAARVGLPPDAFEQRGSVTSAELASLYESADLTMIPSLAEGFSIPVAESVRRGTPVVASDIAAHRELLGSGPWLVEPTNIDGFAAAIARVCGARERIAEEQRRALGDISNPDAVVHRVTAALEPLVARSHTRSRTRAGPHGRPRVALVSPFPPQRTGIADYAEFTFAAVAKHADVEVYSAAAHMKGPTFRMRPLGAEPFLSPRFDAVVNVVGNSHFHFPILDLMRAYGGSCIAHDNRMVEGYRYDRGDEWTAALLSTKSNSVTADLLDDLLEDLDRLPAIGYDIIARTATPLVVHGRALADRILRETGIAATVVPFVPYHLPSVAINPATRADARAALGLDERIVHVATFGFVDRRTKGVDLVVGAAGWLRSWGVPVHLHIVGDGPPEEVRALEGFARELGIASHLTSHGHVSREVLEQFLLAVDAAVQLRTSSLLSLSGALLDCIAFGVPTVTTDEIARDLEAPPYVVATKVPTSSLILAEAIETLRDRRRIAVPEIEQERRAYLARRSADAYARGLLDALGLGVE